MATVYFARFSGDDDGDDGPATPAVGDGDEEREKLGT